MATKKVRLVLYVDPELKKDLERLAKAARPPTSTGKLAIFLLQQGKAIEESRILRLPSQGDR